MYYSHSEIMIHSEIDSLRLLYTYKIRLYLCNLLYLPVQVYIYV